MSNEQEYRTITFRLHKSRIDRIITELNFAQARVLLQDEHDLERIYYRVGRDIVDSFAFTQDRESSMSVEEARVTTEEAETPGAEARQ